MKNNITTLEISNFKSIKHINMDCKRINVLIGKPNVGKSNILEALALYITPYCSLTEKVLEEYIRYEKLSNLFYDQDRKKAILVNSNIGFASVRYEMSSVAQYIFMLGPAIDILLQMENAVDTLAKGYSLESEENAFYKIAGKFNNAPKITDAFYLHFNENPLIQNQGQLNNRPLA